MAINPKYIPSAVSLDNDQLDTILDGNSVVKGDDTFTADESTLYLTPDTSISYEAQTLTEEQKAQARQNIGVSSGGVDIDGTTITENSSNQIQAVGITNGTTPILYNDIYGAITTTWEV